MNELKLITFDLDDTLWDNKPTIINAENKARGFIEDKIGKIYWGSFEDFLKTRNDLINKDPSIEWDIGKLRKEIYKLKIMQSCSDVDSEKITNEAFDLFMKERNKIKLFNGVKESLVSLSNIYSLGVLTNGNADVFNLEIGKYFSFSISSYEAKANKPSKEHFEMAREKIKNLSFENILHIGDHQVNDMYGANELGIEILWFNNNNQVWSQNFNKPYEFSSWYELPKIIKNKYG